MNNAPSSTDVSKSRFVAEDLVSQTIGERYAIRELIARGGTSFIYKALDKELGRLVALKVRLSPRTAMSPFDEENIRRLKREGKGLAQMKHPNIVPLFDAGLDEDTLPHYDIYYMAMELMEGETLEKRLKNVEAHGKRMAWREVLAIIQGVATALDYAHEHKFQFVHRDVKPSNIMLVDDKAYLFDFGLLKALSFPTTTVERKTFADFKKFTIDGMAMGTPAYWSPEQIKGIEIDSRTDVYSLGGVLYCMLTDQLPYEDDPFGLAHLHEPSPRPSSVDRALFAFDSIVARAMAKDPGDRYQSAGELAQALEAALMLTPDSARGTELATAQDIVRRIPRWLGGLLVILVAIALMLFGVRYFNWLQPPTSLPLGWQSSTTGVFMEVKDDDDYLVTITEDNTSYTIFREGEQLENPNISLEGELRSGPWETAYGLVFQYAGDSNYYAFAVTGLGQVGIWQRKVARWIALTPADQTWASRKYIHTDRPNRLEVTIEHGEARGWVNNQPVFEIELEETRPSHVGFFISTSREAKEPEATIRFANFTVRR